MVSRMHVVGRRTLARRRSCAGARLRGSAALPNGIHGGRLQDPAFMQQLDPAQLPYAVDRFQVQLGLVTVLPVMHVAEVVDRAGHTPGHVRPETDSSSRDYQTNTPCGPVWVT